MATKYFLTDDAWLNLGTLPAVITNNTPHLIYYIISDLAPGALADAHEVIFTEKKTLTGTSTQRLYARIGSATSGVFATRDGENINAERTDIVAAPPGLDIEDVVEAFKAALNDIDTLDIVDAVPTFATTNNTATEPFIGFRANRGSQDAFWVWNEAIDRWAAYLSTDGLATKTLANVEFGTVHAALTGNATSADKLSTPRNITLAGDLDGTNTFDGSTNVSISLTLKNQAGLSPGAYTKVTVNAKGQVIAATQLSAGDVTTALTYTPYGPANAAVGATPNTLALRNASGDIVFNVVAATDFIGALTGNAATATKLFAATQINGKTFDGSAPVNLTTADVAENTNLYFTQSRARNVLSGSGGVSYNASTGVISLASGGTPVTSVNGKTGAVTLDTADVIGLDTALALREAARVSPTALTHNATIPNTTSGMFYKMTCGASDVFIKLPVVAGLPDGFSCYMLAEGLTYYGKSKVQTTDGKNISYRNVDSVEFLMLGVNEIFKFTWFSGLSGGTGLWVGECVKQPGSVSVSRNYSGGSWNNSSTAYFGIVFNQSGGSNNTFNVSESSLYLRVPVIGTYFNRYGLYFSAGGGGGVSGYGYVLGSNKSSYSANASYNYNFQYFDVSTAMGAMLNVEWTDEYPGGSVSGGFAQSSNTALFYYPPNNAGYVSLVSR